MKTWKKLAVHRSWVVRCSITESINLNTDERRFCATIDGWNNWRIIQVDATSPEIAQQVIERVREILYKIDAGDESIFEQDQQAW